MLDFMLNGDFPSNLYYKHNIMLGVVTLVRMSCQSPKTWFHPIYKTIIKHISENSLAESDNAQCFTKNNVCNALIAS